MASPTEKAASVVNEVASSQITTMQETVFFFLIIIILSLGAAVYKLWQELKSAKNNTDEVKYNALESRVDELESDWSGFTVADTARKKQWEEDLLTSNRTNEGFVNKAVKKMTDTCTEQVARLSTLETGFKELNKQAAVMEHKHEELRKDVDEMAGNFREQNKEFQEEFKKLHEFMIELRTEFKYSHKENGAG